MLKLRVFSLFLLLSFTVGSCKKAIDEQKLKYVLGVMTTGRWVLEYYGVNDVDYTSDFQPYEFQFYEDSRIEALSSTNSITSAGTWSGDPATLIMTIEFKPVQDPNLVRISHPWLITGNRIGAVFAETTTASGKIVIRLKKKV